MRNVARNPLLDILEPPTTPKKRAPTVVNFNVLPDIGKMDGRSRSAKRIGYLEDRNARGNVRLRFKRCSAPRNLMAWILPRGCAIRRKNYRPASTARSIRCCRWYRLSTPLNAVSERGRVERLRRSVRTLKILNSRSLTFGMAPTQRAVPRRSNYRIRKPSLPLPPVSD